MLCDICKKRDANIFLKKTENGKKIEYNLCEICSSKIESPLINLNTLKTDFLGSISDMLVGFSDFESMNTQKTVKSCSLCGYTLEEFKKTGRFGCEKCYEVFEEELTPLIKRLQGNIQHSGKLPPAGKEKKKINILKEELLNAVEKEEYERAAVLRDQIKELEED